MAETVIEVRNIAKQYRLGKIGSGTLAHDVQRWWARVRGKEDPFLWEGSSNDREKTAESEYVWALKDINFDVKRGEVMAIIGKNGAGKSTLLKILSQVTEPTLGSVRIKGRVASLLEVGTGFHPDLSGRENVFLNGAILGMTKKEIERKFDEIVDFSGVQRYIDTPVKRYSSGMKVRLGFAVAAYLEPEILVVDEVLAVGDAEFQAKCLGKMQDVAGSGRTVLFVSHNLSAVRNLCNVGIVLKNGLKSFEGDVENAISFYRTSFSNDSGIKNNERSYSKISNVPFQFTHVKMINPKGALVSKYEFVDKIIIQANIFVNEMKNDNLIIIFLEDDNGNLILTSANNDDGDMSLLSDIPNGEHVVKIELPFQTLKPGVYHVTLSARGQMDEPYHKIENCLTFEVFDTQTYRGMKGLYRKTAIIAPELGWSIQKT